VPDVRTRLRWLGHSTVLADVDGTRIVTDPVLRRRVLHLRRDAEVAPPGDVDAILVSHLHYDHLDLPSLARIGVGTPIVIPRGGSRLVRGFERVTEVQPGVELSIAGLRISVVEAQHEGRRRNMGAFIPAVGYILEGTHRIYFAGDTDLFDGMRELAPLDVALLPVSGWGPKVGAGHLDPERAAAALPMLRPRIAVPIHWGTYRVIGSTPAGSEPAQAFAVAARRTAPDVDVRVLPLGGALDL
jgi:L-ascorbate metabolism protein UlaG (beta-lactamase superfamily)